MSKKAEIAIKGGVVVDGKGFQRRDLFIKDGLIDSLEASGSNREAQTTINAEGKLVLPGIIDAHMHPVYADKMDTLSKGAALGGITTLIPFIGAVKAWGKSGNLYDAVMNLISEGKESSAVDYAIHCSLMHDDFETLADVVPKVIQEGVISFKGFMAFAKRGMKLSDEELIKAMEIVSKAKGIFAVHAENGTILDYLEDNFISQNMVTPEYYYKSHPNISEAEAVFRILSLAQIIDCPLYLVHLSTKESLDVVRLFRKWNNVKLFTETCTHYLTLTNEDMIKRGSLAKVGPPLREQEDVEKMWMAVDQGEIDVIGSDTAGHMLFSKEPHMDEIFKAPSGLPGQQEMFTVTYDEGVNKGRTTLPKLIKTMCENPARIFGLYPKKGVIQPGSDADVCIFDPYKDWIITADALETKVDYTMFEGRQCLGAPQTVLLRGNVLVEDGVYKGNPGMGRYLPGKPKE